MLRRLPDWKSRLTRFVLQARSMPFQPGVHDCALFAAGAVDAQCGSGIADNWRGRYKSLKGGLRVLARDGASDHIALAAGMLPDRVLSMARPGDIAVIDDSLGVVQGEAVYVLTPSGLGLLELGRARRVLGVG